MNLLAGLNRISSLLEAIPDSREPRAKPEFLRVHLMSRITPSSFWMGCSRIYRIHSFPRNAHHCFLRLLRLPSMFLHLSLLVSRFLLLSFTSLLSYFSYAFVFFCLVLLPLPVYYLASPQSIFVSLSSVKNIFSLIFLL